MSQEPNTSKFTSKAFLFFQSFDCPLQYCLHRDQHKSRFKFICPICTGLYDAPYKYYRHSCMEIQKDGLFKKPLSLPDTETQIYRQLPVDKVEMMLSCPICKRNFRYASHFVVHLRDTQNCFTSLSLLRKKDKQIFHLDLYFEEHCGLPRKPVECDQVKIVCCSMGVRRLFSRGGQKFSRGGQEPNFCLKKQQKRYYFSPKKSKTYYFWPARGGARAPLALPCGRSSKLFCAVQSF